MIGAAVTALLVAAARDLPLDKQCEFRVASGAVIPNLGKIKLKSTDESGFAGLIRGLITDVAKPLLSARCGGSRGDGTLFFEDGGIFLERNSPTAGSSWQEHQTFPRRKLVQRVRATWRNGRGRWRS